MNGLKYVFVLFFVGLFTSGLGQTIDQIEFTGLKRTKESFLRRLMKTQPGTTYDSLRVATDVERLNRLPGIAKATSELREEQGQFILEYAIVENFTIIPGLRTSEANDGSFAYRLSVFEFNLLGRNQLIGGYYERNIFNSYGGFWEAPYLFTNKLGIGISVQDNTRREPIFFNEKDPTNYRFRNLLGEAYLMYEHDFHNNFRLGARISHEEYEFLDGLNNPSFPQSLEADKLTFISRYELNHLVIDYQYITGYRNELDLQYVTGGTGLLADEFIGRNTTEYFQKVGKKGNWASRLQLAYANFNASRFSPFVLDNQVNIRGAGNSAGRGTAEITLNTEYRHTLIEKGWFVLQSNTFLDVGTWRKPGQNLDSLVNGDNLLAHPGVGLRFIHKRIFNAVLRIDYGIGLGNNQQSGIVFGIGQFF